MIEDKDNLIYRLDLDFNQFQQLQQYINKIDNVSKEDLFYFNEMKEIVNAPKKIKHSAKKHTAVKTATEARTKKAKEKILNAINILRMEDKKLTHYSIAKEANVSYVTVKKYISLDEIKYTFLISLHQ